MFGRIFTRSFALTILVMSAAFFTFAQDLDDVTISGKIVDANGQAILGASVTATLTETKETRTVVTDDEGKYVFLKLKPGTYKVKVTAAGFGAQETPDIVTISAQNVQKEFKLVPAGVTAEQTITVTEDDTPLVDTTRTIVGSTITEREIEEIPNASRNPLDLVLTLGGTAEEQLSTRDLADDRGLRGQTAPGQTPEEAGIFGLSGGAAYSNNITIDGLDNNDDRGASFRFQPSIESISEVQVITNQFSAEYGRASGGRINLRTRGGSNRFRGRAFYFFRDDNLNANTWNNNRLAIDRPPLRNHNPGFTFGGPAIKNKLFFFASYEYDNIADTTVLDAWVPVGFSNPNFPLPTPNNPQTFLVGGVTVGRYITPAATPAKKHIFTGRVDWTINDAQNATFRYDVGRSNDLRAFNGVNRIEASLIGRVRDTDAFSGTHNWVLSSRFVNQFRFQWSTLKPSSAQAAGELSPAVLVNFTGPAGQGGTQVFGSSTNASDRAEDRFQFQNTSTFISGNNTFRFGGDFHHIDTLFTDRFDITGTYTFPNFTAFGQNLPSRYQQNFDVTSELLNKYIGVFGQADWKARSNLTISYGLRWEKETVLDDNDNFGPRFAVAWNPFPKSNKTVIRFGAGRFFNRVLLRTIDDYTGDTSAIRLDTNSLNVPTGTVLDSTRYLGFLATQFPNGLTRDTLIPVNATQSFTAASLGRSTTAFRSLSNDLVIPESYQFNVGFERELSKAWVFETNFTYNKTVHLWRENNRNAAAIPSGTPDRNGDGVISAADYLLGLTAGPYRFEAVPTATNPGLRGIDGSACTSSAQVCVGNLNQTTTGNPNCSTTSVTNSVICRAFAAINPLRPLFSSVGAVQLEEVQSIGNSEYLGAIFELRSRYRRAYGFGGSMRFVYTLSKLMDDGIVNTSNPSVPGDFRREWSRSLADRRHRIAISGTFDLPKYLGKLRLSPLFRYGSSSPFNLSGGGLDRSLDDLSNDRPNFVGDTSDIRWRVFQSSAFPQEIASRFTQNQIGAPGNLPRNAGNGPRQFTFDLSVSREFRFTERLRFRPMAEFNNVLNATVFSFGSNFIDFGNLTSGTAQEGFLAPTRTVAPRRIRLGFRFDF